MDLEALFKISHGLYVTGAKDGQGRLIGSCIDAVMVIEAVPAQIMISLCKTSYTCENVLRTGRLTLSVLSDDTADDIIRTFGMQSSRDIDKWATIQHGLRDGLPVLEVAVSRLSLRVVHRMETATHFVFLCDVVSIEKGEDKPSLIYADYQKRKQGKEKKMTTEGKKWVCTVCGYVYDGETPFEELPEDWVCPLCGEPKSVFVQE